MEARRNRLSCDRCHTLKLRCPRQNSNDDESCYRCLPEGLQCMFSKPLPKGRPRTNLNLVTANTAAKASSPDPIQAGTTGISFPCSTSSSPKSSTSPVFCRVPFDEDVDTTMTTSQSTYPGMNSSACLQNQLEGQEWSDALAAIRLEGDVFAPPQLEVSLQDPLRYVGSYDGDESNLLPTGYLGLGNASRPRFVESAFWALVHGQVINST